MSVADPLETRPIFTWVIMPNLIAVGTWSNGTSIRAEIRLKKIRSSRPGVVTQHHRVSRVERLPVTSCLLSVVTTGNLVSEINGNFGRKRKIFPPRVFSAPAEGSRWNVATLN